MIFIGRTHGVPMFVHSGFEPPCILRAGEAGLEKLAWKGVADIETSTSHAAVVKGRGWVSYLHSS